MHTCSRFIFHVLDLREFRVLGLDPENVKTAGGVGNANVDFTIKTVEMAESGVDGVGTICGGHDDIGGELETVHQGKQLRNDMALDFAICLQEKEEENTVDDERRLG